jgi:ERCC4-type nuclease
MQLYLDCREAALIPHLPGATVRQLTLGDAAIEKDGVEIALIERKTVADLAASIKDGRYAEQSRRLQECAVPNHNIIYLIEGSLRSTNLPMPRRTLLASMVSLNYGKGFSVVRTESLEQTAEFMQVMLEKLQKESGYVAQEANATAVKKQKRDNITPANIDRLMLSQIPFVSAQTAEAILAKFHSIEQLLQALRADPACLDNVTFETSKRKISSKSVASLKTFLLK